MVKYCVEITWKRGKQRFTKGVVVDLSDPSGTEKSVIRLALDELNKSRGEYKNWVKTKDIVDMKRWKIYEGETE